MFLNCRWAAAFAVALIVTPAHAVTCVVEGSEFTFQERGYGTIFGHGTQANADIAYRLLKRELGNPADYKKPVIFYTKAAREIVRHECAGEKCTGTEMQLGWKACSEGAKTSDEICLPLAVVYDSKLYCLLQPNPPFDPNKRFVPYTPPFNR